MPTTVELSCRDVELKYGNSGCKCVHYRRLFAPGYCDGFSVSEHSPGMVEDDETLYRFLLPEHLTDGPLAIRPDAFRAVEALGLSVFRERHVPLRELGDRARMYAKRRGVPLSDLSLAMARCGDVRAITLSGDKSYSVYDTASEHSPAHADVCRALTFPLGTPNQRVHFKTLHRELARVFTVERGFLG